MADASLLKNILDRRKGQYGYFVVEACLEKTAGGYENLFAKLSAVKDGETKTVQSPLDFGSYAFVAQRLEVNEVQSLIEQSNPTFEIDQYSFVMANAQLGRHYSERLSSNNLWSDWPVELIELRSMGGANYIPPKALVSHDTNRVFRDVYDGIDQYIGDKISNNSSWLRAVLLVLPDYRVRISDIDCSEQDVITIRLERDERPADLRVHGLIDGSGRQEIAEQINGSEATINLKSKIEQIENLQLFITAPEGILDYYEQNPLHHSGRIRWLARPQQRESQKDENLLLEIQNGEGVHLEFKPYVHPDKTEGKVAELIRAAIAFANTSGGAILLGVRNTTEIDGIEKELRQHTAASTLKAAAEEYARRVKTILNDAIATSVRLDIKAQPVELAGHILLRIDVQELPFDGKPAWKLDSKDAWIRRGSNNVKADPDMILASFGKEQGDQGELWGTRRAK